MLIESYLERCEPCGGKGWHDYTICDTCLGRGEVVADQERKAVREAIDNWQRWLKRWRAAWRME